MKEKIENLKIKLDATVAELETSGVAETDDKQLGFIKDLHQHLNNLQNDVQEQSFVDETERKVEGILTIFCQSFLYVYILK